MSQNGQQASKQANKQASRQANKPGQAHMQGQDARRGTVRQQAKAVGHQGSKQASRPPAGQAERNTARSSCRSSYSKPAVAAAGIAGMKDRLWGMPQTRFKRGPNEVQS